MIEEKDYRLPKHEQPKPKMKDDTKTIEALEQLPFRPIGYEW